MENDEFPETTTKGIPMDDDEFSQWVKAIEDPERRNLAIDKLGASNQHVRAHPHLVKIAMDDSIPESDRYNAVSSLNEPWLEETILALRTILATISDSSSILLATITALGLQGDTQSGEKIIQYSSPEYKESLRYTAIEALGRMGYFPAIPHLQKMLKDPSQIIRHYSSSALIQISGSVGHNPQKYDVLPDLLPLLDDPNQIIRNHMQATLNYIEKRRNQ